MPKGVEHLPAVVLIQKFKMPIYSVMPKGVEHFWFKAGTAPLREPIYSVMPKGVEHYQLDVGTDWIDVTDILRDAERR